MEFTGLDHLRPLLDRLKQQTSRASRDAALSDEMRLWAAKVLETVRTLTQFTNAEDDDVPRQVLRLSIFCDELLACCEQADMTELCLSEDFRRACREVRRSADSLLARPRHH